MCVCVGGGGGFKEEYVDNPGIFSVNCLLTNISRVTAKSIKVISIFRLSMS